MSIARGIIRIARFRIDGLMEFGTSKQAFLNSLAPLLAFPLVGALLEIGQGQVADAVTDLLASVVALLVPLVISEFLADRWGVSDSWLRYAVVVNWAQWTMPLALAAMISAVWLLGEMGMNADQNMVAGAAIGVVIYGVALHWFLARYALGLSRGKSWILVGICDLVTVMFVVIPRLVALHFNG